MNRAAVHELSFADEVVEAMRLAPLFAGGVLTRCCRRAGLDTEALGPRDMERLLPELESVLRVYKKGPETLAALDRLRRLASRPQPVSGLAPRRPR